MPNSLNLGLVFLLFLVVYLLGEIVNRLVIISKQLHYANERLYDICCDNEGDPDGPGDGEVAVSPVMTAARGSAMQGAVQQPTKVALKIVR